MTCHVFMTLRHSTILHYCATYSLTFLHYLKENVQHELLRLVCKNKVATLHRTGSHWMYGFKGNQQYRAGRIMKRM